MFLRAITCAIVFLYLVTELKSENALLENRAANLTIKHGNTTQINFVVKDPNSHLVQAQLDSIR